MGIRGGGTILTSKATQNFLSRTSGLDRGHINAYTDLLDGLTDDGLFNRDGTSSFFDALYIFATNSSNNALLNLVSSSFTGTANGSPTFTTDRGFTGVDSSSTVFIDTGFNPTTAPSPKFTINSVHISLWSNTDTFSSSLGGATMGSNSVSDSEIICKFSDGNGYFRATESSAATSSGIAVSNASGHFIANRSASSTENAYRNATDLGLVAVASVTPDNNTIYILARNNAGSAEFGDSRQISMASMGGSLTSTQVTKFYNRLRTYMTAVGVP